MSERAMISEKSVTLVNNLSRGNVDSNLGIDGVPFAALN